MRRPYNFSGVSLIVRLMLLPRQIAFLWIVVLFLLTQSACFFSGGVSTFNKQTRASGSGFLSASERNGQWDADGPPPKVGDVTDRTVYQKMEKTAVLSFGYFGKIYELTNPYPLRRRRIAAIREIGTDTENGATVHYYEVEFDPETGS
jgi:hypothetical protein